MAPRPQKRVRNYIEFCLIYAADKSRPPQLERRPPVHDHEGRSRIHICLVVRGTFEKARFRFLENGPAARKGIPDINPWPDRNQKWDKTASVKPKPLRSGLEPRRVCMEPKPLTGMGPNKPRPSTPKRPRSPVCARKGTLPSILWI